MENLKVTIYLDSPVVLDRNTTIDGILLASYYRYLNKKGKVLPFDKNHSSVDFIERKNGIFSGSVWYIDNQDDVLFDFNTIVKKQEYNKIQKVTGKKTRHNSLFKSALVNYETITVDKIYFYIRAKEIIVRELLRTETNFIGKNQNLGLGRIRDVDVEAIDEDKGFFLDSEKKVVSKPLDCRYFDVESDAVAFHRNMPPYWLKEDLTPCYMPSNILVEEFVRPQQSSDYTSIKDMEYISNVRFVYENRGKAKDREIDYSKKTKKTTTYQYTDDNIENKCAFTGEIHSKGIYTDPKQYIRDTRSNFADFEYIDKNKKFISEDAMWVLENIKEIGNTLVSNDGIVYLQGKLATEETRIKNYINDTTLLKPPFSINLKDTQNTQHIVFKCKVSISNAYFYVQFGNKTLDIDSDTLKRAIYEIDEIVKNNKDITKSHLCGNYRDYMYLIQKNTKEKDKNFKIIMNFQKKYSSNIRHILSVIAL